MSLESAVHHGRVYMIEVEDSFAEEGELVVAKRQPVEDDSDWSVHRARIAHRNIHGLR